jgi:hypothetical protein
MKNARGNLLDQLAPQVIRSRIDTHNVAYNIQFACLLGNGLGKWHSELCKSVSLKPDAQWIRWVVILWLAVHLDATPRLQFVFR